MNKKELSAKVADHLRHNTICRLATWSTVCSTSSQAKLKSGNEVNLTGLLAIYRQHAHHANAQPQTGQKNDEQGENLRSV